MDSEAYNAERTLITEIDHAIAQTIRKGGVDALRVMFPETANAIDERQDHVRTD